jgi:putative acetyltransferase
VWSDAVIRRAESADAASIRAVHLAAFPTAAEAYLVERIEQDGDRVASLVAEREGEVAGHVLLSRMVVSGDGRALRAVGLGPVAVHPRFQRSGIGSGLVRDALAVAAETGEEMVFVVGEPEYYSRFGFSAQTAKPFASPYAGPYLMALSLREGWALPGSGEAAYARAFSQLEDEL